MTTPVSKSRDAISKTDSHPVTVWVPLSVVAEVDAAVRRQHTDRSKWIREAIREKAERDGGGGR